MPTSALVVAVLLNGVPINFGNVPPRLKPHSKDGVLVVPVRQVLESIGADVSANNMKGRRNYDEVYVTYNGKETSLRETYKIEYTKIDQGLKTFMWPAGNKLPDQYRYCYITSTYYSEVKPGFEKTYRLMMPLGFLSSTFGFSLRWNAEKQIASIETK